MCHNELCVHDLLTVGLYVFFLSSTNAWKGFSLGKSLFDVLGCTFWHACVYLSTYEHVSVYMYELYKKISPLSIHSLSPMFTDGLVLCTHTHTHTHVQITKYTCIKTVEFESSMTGLLLCFSYVTL